MTLKWLVGAFRSNTWTSLLHLLSKREFIWTLKASSRLLLQVVLRAGSDLTRQRN